MEKDNLYIICQDNDLADTIWPEIERLQQECDAADQQIMRLRDVLESWQEYSWGTEPEWVQARAGVLGHD